LPLNEGQTKITNILKEKALFLGTYISRSSKHTLYRMRSSASKRQALQLRFNAPIQRIVNKLHNQGFMVKNKPYPKFV